MDPAPPQDRAAEAARYAVLRRVGPALKHDLVVDLQAVAMMAEVLGARLDRSAQPQAQLQHHAAQMQRVAREAVAHALKVAAWLAPTDRDVVDLGEGLREGLDLVRNHLGFRGFGLRADLPEGDFEVSDDLLRYLLPAALVHLADQAAGPGELRVQARVQGPAAELTLSLEPDAGAGEPEPEDPGRRPITAADLQALAAAASVRLQAGPDRVDVWLPRLVPTSPLGIAPR